MSASFIRIYLFAYVCVYIYHVCNGSVHITVQKSLQDLFDSEEDDENGGGYKPFESSRERRARRKAEKQSKEP